MATRCAELNVDFALADIKFTTALTYAACTPVYKMVKPVARPRPTLSELMQLLSTEQFSAGSASP